MTARIILARHGNTFAPMEEPVWVGARTDLPLTEKGLSQAENLGNAVASSYKELNAIYSGPLLRTKRTAEIVAQHLRLSEQSIKIDDRLTEIDYGLWEGLATPAIIAMYGETEISAWNEDSVFPTTPGWKPEASQISANIDGILSETTSGVSLAVTSNGILRFFAKASKNCGEFPRHKVATGNICIMDRTEQGIWQIVAWDAPPETLIKHK